MQRGNRHVAVSKWMFLRFAMFDLQCSVPSTTFHNGNMDLVSFKTAVKKRISYVMLLLWTKYHLKLYSLCRNLRTNNNLRIFIGKIISIYILLILYSKLFVYVMIL